LLGVCAGVLLSLLAQRGPDMLVWWGQSRLRARWRRISRWRGGRPRISPDVIALIRYLSSQNPLWGAPHIHGELRKLGHRVSQSSVSRYMLRRRGRPQQNWRAFLVNHWDEIAAIDMLTVFTQAHEYLYAFVVLGLSRRAILHIEVGAHPTAEWLAQQLREAFPWDVRVPRFIVRDNDGAYGRIFRQRLYAIGIRDRPTTPRSPWQNGYVERLIGSIRRECLDYIVIGSEAHLRRVLREYADYYNNNRTHLALDKDTPNGRQIETEGVIVSRPVLGGLHHRYERKLPG